LKKPAWIGTGEVLPKNKGDFLLDFVLVLSNGVYWKSIILLDKIAKIYFEKTCVRYHILSIYAVL
jgi:hypothetical protein